jgi:hypothetical protein
MKSTIDASHAKFVSGLEETHLLANRNKTQLVSLWDEVRKTREGGDDADISNKLDSRTFYETLHYVVNNFDGAKQFLNSKFKVVNMEEGFPQARATTLTLQEPTQDK